MSLDLTAIRTELAAAAPTGWAPYDYLPGSASLPALVVSLPDRIDLGASLGLAEIELPIILVIGGRFSKASEGRLMASALEVAAAYRGLTGVAFKSCRVTSIDQFLSVTVGTTEALSCSLNLELLAAK